MTIHVREAFQNSLHDTKDRGMTMEAQGYDPIG